ncbi:MAG: MBOAT family protein [Clostridia bacterium]|nr:MBOAT family protein [Clostridia bacterium]
MAFSELRFVFLFLPLALLLHKLMPMKLKNLVLTVLSLLFFAWGSTRYMVLMVLLIVFNYFSGLLIEARKEQQDRRAAKIVLITAVVLDLLLLGFFKYWGFVLENVNAVLRTHFSTQVTSTPMGVSFFTFSLLSYLFDVYRDKTPMDRNFLNFSLFVTFFPKLVSGPIISYSAMAKQIRERKLSAVRFGHGCRMFLVGLAKKVLLSNTLGTTFYAVSAMAPENVSVVTGWIGAVSYSLMLYFDFSGYSDMAIGLAHMFGFEFGKNFDYPYMSASITEFWRRWHMSLGAWFRDYVYIPLGGSRVSKGKVIRNLLIVWALTGIWHGASWNFIFWGLYYGGLLLLEKFVLAKFLEKVPTILKRIGTVLLVVIGWVFFFSPDLGSAFRWLGCMFGIGGSGLLDEAARYYLSSSAIILAISALGAYPLAGKFGNLILKRAKWPVYVTVAWFALLFFLCIAGTMVSTYSSFLYFQF